ncbi:unnamed protein product [Arctia plantaginis]|uniref:Uncharacterized protein n=1 Tax=Arctia plantaginis TaxID=874455 RepID=A0A8S1BK30_ARCPL|nr:unnamed protein product [Arctia plantaginis]CAB3259798.1 unnamed protein product [Arctia plantaginis]
MRSLVVLFALVAVAVAAPHGGQLVAYQQQVPVSYVVPSAVSHQSRVDYNGHFVPTEQLVAASPYGAGLAPAFYAANPVFGGPLAHNYYGGQVFAPFAAPGAVFAAY